MRSISIAAHLIVLVFYHCMLSDSHWGTPIMNVLSFLYKRNRNYWYFSQRRVRVGPNNSLIYQLKVLICLRRYLYNTNLVEEYINYLKKPIFPDSDHQFDCVVRDLLQLPGSIVTNERGCDDSPPKCDAVENIFNDTTTNATTASTYFP